MSRLRFAPLALLPMLAWATPASARSFVVAKAGDKPSIAIETPRG